MSNVVDIYPNEVIEREATEAELAARDELDAALANRLSEEARIEALKVSARAKLVAGEPLTAEEAATLVI